MRQYLLSVYQPDGEPPPPEVLAPIMADLGGFTVIQLLGGLTTAEIAHAFLVPEPTMAQRIVRAKGMRLGARLDRGGGAHTCALYEASDRPLLVPDGRRQPRASRQKRMSGPHRLSDDAGMFAPLIVAGPGLEGTCG